MKLIADDVMSRGILIICEDIPYLNCLGFWSAMAIINIKMFQIQYETFEIGQSIIGYRIDVLGLWLVVETINRWSKLHPMALNNALLTDVSCKRDAQCQLGDLLRMVSLAASIRE